MDIFISKMNVPDLEFTRFHKAVWHNSRAVGDFSSMITTDGHNYDFLKLL